MRLDGRGHIDRATPVAFTFDGRPLAGYAGDTLASALLANGVRLVGRSFKYHRPRGILSAGPEEPNALVTIGTGASGQPNVRATVQELYPDLAATSQNRWPGLGWDVMAVNDLLAPFLGAGFYYKTFMWPRAFWERLYEPLIRRAAGLGRLSGLSNPDPYEKAFAFCDLLVIGAGPAGLMAALTAGRAGARVILAEADPHPGGRLLAEDEAIDGQPAPRWAAAVLAELGALPNVRVMTRTSVVGAYDGGTYAAVERVGLHRADPGPDLPREAFWRIVAPRAILATGAVERLIAFPGNDRPGIMLAGSVRAYLHRWGVAPGRRITVFGNNDDAHRTARDLSAAGVEVAALIDVREGVLPPGDFPVYSGAQVVATRGRMGLRAITVADHSGLHEIETDCLAVSGGWNPAIQLACHRNNRPQWHEDRAVFLPAPGAVAGLSVCGAASGAFSTAAALSTGRAAAAEALELTVALPDLPMADDSPLRIRPFWEVRARGRAWVDLSNDVTTKDVRLAAQEGFASPEHMKRYTTLGMAPDQGRTGATAALAVLADATGATLAATGPTTYRPPSEPVTIAALGAGGQGAGFAPQRFTTSDAAARAHGAPMIEAGLWYRAAYFPRPGETHWRQSCDREVGHVRNAVGVCDVSTLGKIDVQGADSGAFLDLVYANTMSTLAPGRIRYGVMLREDGMAMDDGTCACLGPGHYLVTTTTAAAGQVMRHLDFVAQAHLPQADVHLASVTETWAQFAIAGPRARDLLAGLLDAPVSLSFMHWAPVRVAGVEGRLFRISFSGEEGYEIALPARYGAALWRDLVARAEGLGGGAYGMEALNVLRIEKGFLTHAEMHGRVTAADLGLGRMVAAKDCIGRAASLRPGLVADDREQFVGLKPVDPGQIITAGAHLFTPGEETDAAHDQGYVTSACWSPTLNTHLALGFLKGGRARLGEMVRFRDGLRDIDALCEVCDPVFFDPEGGRARV